MLRMKRQVECGSAVMRFSPLQLAVCLVLCLPWLSCHWLILILVLLPVDAIQDGACETSELIVQLVVW